jgi:hypothetical protein
MSEEKDKSIWTDDPVIQEVRRARAQLWEEGGGTIEGYMRVVKEKAAKARERQEATAQAETE